MMPGGPGQQMGPMAPGQASIPQPPRQAVPSGPNVNGSSALLGTIPTSCTGDAYTKYVALAKQIVAGGVCANYAPSIENQAGKEYTCNHPCATAVKSLLQQFQQCMTDTVAPIMQTCFGLSRNRGDSVPPGCSGELFSKWQNISAGLATNAACRNFQPDLRNASTLVSSVCQHACYAALKEASATVSVCMPRNIQAVLNMCNMENEQYCGVAALRLASVTECYGKSNTSCDGVQCRVIAGRCQYYPPASNYLPCKRTSCGWKAFSDLVQSGNDDPATASQALSVYDRYFCVSNGQDNCYELLKDIVTDPKVSSPETVTNETLNGLCTVPAKSSCFVALQSAQAQQMRDEAGRYYSLCVAQARGSPQQQQRCVSDAQSRNSNAGRMDAAAMAFCAKNGKTGEASRYCMQVSRAANSDTCFRKLMDKQKPTCDATCVPSVKGLVESIGCCGFLFAKMGSDVPLRPEQLPKADDGFKPTINNTGPAPAQQGAPPPGYFDFLKVCSGLETNVFKGLDEKCPVRPAGHKPPKKELAMGIRWDQLAADPETKARLEEAARADAATTAGVPVDNIVNGTFVENTEVKIAVTAVSTTGRRQTSTSVSTAKYEFYLDTDTAEAQATAEATFASQVAAGNVASTSTSSTVSSSCSDCTVSTTSGSDSLVVTSAPSTTPAQTPKVGSGASVLATVLVLATAVLVSLA